MAGLCMLSNRTELRDHHNGKGASKYARTHRTDKKGASTETESGQLEFEPPVTALVAVLEERGVISVETDANGNWVSDSNGRPQFELDANGWYVWEEDPVSAVRFTSSISYNASGHVVYRYEVENLSALERDFELNQVRPPAYPQGWSGTVSADDSVYIEWVVTVAQDMCVQTSQFSAETTDPDYETDGEPFRLSEPVEVYVPRAGLEYDGGNMITSASHNVGLGTTAVSFQLTGTDVAEQAVLLRRDSSGAWEELVSDDGPFLRGTTYTLTDPDPPVGLSVYLVQTGCTNNGYFSVDEAPVVR